MQYALTVIALFLFVGCQSQPVTTVHAPSVRQVASIEEDAPYFLEALGRANLTPTEWQRRSGVIVGGLEDLLNLVFDKAEQLILVQQNKRIEAHLYRIAVLSGGKSYNCDAAVGVNDVTKPHERAVVVFCRQNGLHLPQKVFEGYISK